MRSTEWQQLRPLALTQLPVHCLSEIVKHLPNASDKMRCHQMGGPLRLAVNSGRSWTNFHSMHHDARYDPRVVHECGTPFSRYIIFRRNI
jgi:hypothetical protein